MKKISIYCEVNPMNNKLEEVSYELISKALKLKEQAKSLKKDEEYMIEAIACANALDNESIDMSYKAGANRFVLIKEQALETFTQTVWAQCFLDYYKQNPSEIIIFPATLTGRIIAPRITTALDTGLVADCTGLEMILKDDKVMLASTRPTFGSELMATILSKKIPQCATVRPKTFESEFSCREKGEFVEFKPSSYRESRMKLLRSIFDKSGGMDNFLNANIILTAGYGITEGKDRKYIDKLEQIAKSLGAKVASTRKVVDMDLLPSSVQIGQTGNTVCPKLYIAFGVSGAIQHICGMKNSKTIIAINTDENAEIFKYSDYKIVADAKKIIDELFEILP